MPDAPNQPAQGALGIDAADFASALDASIETKIRIFSTGYRGLVLDGPAELDAANVETVHYLGLHVDNPTGHGRADLWSKAVAVTVGIDNGETRAGWVFEQIHERSPVDYAADDESTNDLSAVSFRLDLTEQVRGLNLVPGRYCTRVFVWDRASNPVVTRLVKSTVNDPAVAEFLESRRRPGWAGPVKPGWGEHHAWYLETPDSPLIPEAAGITLEGERITVEGTSSTLILRSSFRLPLQLRHRVAPIDPGSAANPPIGPAFPRPGAVIPMAILVTGDEYSVPKLVELRVPSFDDIDWDADQPEATGHFRIDLKLAAEPPTFQTYAVWAISGERLAGPILMAWVDPDLVARS